MRRTKRFIIAGGMVERDHVQLLEGYAFYLSGVIELYEATLEPTCLEFATALAERMIAEFYDSSNGGFWQSAAHSQDLDLASERGLRRRRAVREFGGDACLA